MGSWKVEIRGHTLNPKWVAEVQGKGFINKSESLSQIEIDDSQLVDFLKYLASRKEEITVFEIQKGRVVLPPTVPTSAPTSCPACGGTGKLE